MATLLHELIPAEFERRYPGKWHRDQSGAHKDLVCVENDAFSVEIKCSSSKKDIFANRSYAQEGTAAKKSKDGYFLGVNFEKFGTDKSKRPQIVRVAFGWLNHSDWIPQTAATGQQARLTPEAKSYKMLEIVTSK